MGGIVMKPFSLEEYIKNPNQKLVTGDGRKVRRVLCTDARGPYPVIVLVESPDGTADEAQSFTAEGRFFSGESRRIYDLFFAPEKKEGWANIFNVDGCKHLDHKIYESKEDAEKEGKFWSFYVSTIKVEWEE